MLIDRTKALMLMGVIASSAVACTIVEKESSDKDNTGGTHSAGAGGTSAGSAAGGSGGTLKTGGASAAGAGGTVAAGAGGKSTSAGGQASGGQPSSGSLTGGGGQASGGQYSNVGGQGSGGQGMVGTGGAATGSGGSAAACDDSQGMPSSCDPVADLGSCGEFGFEYCKSAITNLKPAVAEIAVDCMRDADDTCGGPPYDCVRDALAEACPDSSANELCAKAVAIEDCSVTLAECHALVDGLNADGRQLIDDCIELDSCNYGLWSCLEGM